MNSESKSKFNLWLSEHPESFLPSDEAWMFDFVNSLHGTEGNICFIKFSVASQGEFHLDTSLPPQKGGCNCPPVLGTATL